MACRPTCCAGGRPPVTANLPPSGRPGPGLGCNWASCGLGSITCTLREIVRLPQGQAAAARALVFRTRAAWRRQVSLPWNRALARRAGSAPLMRLDLHPHDAVHSAVRACWSALLLQALRTGTLRTLDHASRMLWPDRCTGCCSGWQGACQPTWTAVSVVPHQADGRSCRQSAYFAEGWRWRLCPGRARGLPWLLACQMTPRRRVSKAPERPP